MVEKRSVNRNYRNENIKVSIEFRYTSNYDLILFNYSVNDVKFEMHNFLKTFANWIHCDKNKFIVVVS